MEKQGLQSHSIASLEAALPKSMKSIKISLVLLTSCALPQGLAFGPRLESLSNSHWCPRHNQYHASRLYASESEPNHHDTLEESLKLDAPEFDFVSAPFDDIDDFSFLFDRTVFDGRFPSLQERADELASEAFEEKESLEIHAWDNCGDDCKECEIPKDWCEPIETIDVMEYLGVTRVKPLC